MIFKPLLVKLPDIDINTAQRTENTDRVGAIFKICGTAISLFALQNACFVGLVFHLTNT